jgi:hypothetical protein
LTTARTEKRFFYFGHRDIKCKVNTKANIA